jgi:hypothetical protein
LGGEARNLILRDVKSRFAAAGKNTLAAIILLGSIFLAPLVQADDATSESTTFKRIALENLVEQMTSRGGRVAQVEVPVRNSDGETVQQKQAAILKIPEKDRTENEKDLLSMIDKGLLQPRSIIGHHERQYDFTLPPRLDDPATLKVTLQKFIALDPRYKLKTCGTLTVIVPKGDPILTQKATLVVSDVPAADALERLGKILAPFGINYMEVYTGPMRNDGKGLYGDTRVTLHLVDQPLIEICSRMAEALGPDKTWSMLTIEGYGRNFGFNNSIR